MGREGDPADRHALLVAGVQRHMDWLGTGQQPPPPDPARPPTIDWAAALQRCMQDRELLHEILLIFLTEYPRLMSLLEDSWAKSDLREVGYAAHTLKGLVGNIAAMPAHGAALQVERLAGAQNLAALPLAIETLRERMAAVLEALQSQP